MKYLLILVIFLVGCAHLPEDPYPNHAENNYKRVEFDVINSSGTIKEIGIANILLTNTANLEGYTIKIHGISSGQLYLKGVTCGIDISKAYSGVVSINLSDLIPHPMECGIDVVIVTDPLDDKEHKIVEHGFININTITQDVTPAVFEYKLPTAWGNIKTYRYIGQGSYQRQEGGLTGAEAFTVITKSEHGKFRIVGCGYEYQSEYSNTIFEIQLKQIYKKDSITTTDSCDFNLSIIPYDETYSYRGKFLINVYGSKVVKLQPPQFKIDGDKLSVTGSDIIAICTIDETYKISNKCNIKKYLNGVEYWIRTVTTNGRKNVFSIYNGQVKWEE
jgi:hypothetical protein